jgi:hypothetical protein
MVKIPAISTTPMQENQAFLAFRADFGADGAQ